MTAESREIVWTDDPCAGCGRAPYERRDGRTYLYRYGDSEPVCKPQCAARAVAPNPDAAAQGRTGPAPLARDAFADVPEKLDCLDAAGQKEVARLLDRLFTELKRTDALAATALQHARDAESENAELRAEVAALRAEVEALEEAREPFLRPEWGIEVPDQPAFPVQPVRRVERGPDLLRSGVPLTQAAPVVCGYAVNLPVRGTLNVKG